MRPRKNGFQLIFDSILKMNMNNVNVLLVWLTLNSLAVALYMLLKSFQCVLCVEIRRNILHESKRVFSRQTELALFFPHA